MPTSGDRVQPYPFNRQCCRAIFATGREGVTWSGQVSERQPYLPRFMAGGEINPLGARAMYLGNTEYRIHGTNQNG